MICPVCKNMVPDDAKFCRYCGQEILKQSDLSKTSDKEVRNEVEKTNSFPNEHSFKTFVIICVVALCIAAGVLYISNINSTSFSKDDIYTYTCKCESSYLTVEGPFELKDTDPGPIDSSIKTMFYKTGTSSNFKEEVVGVKYNFDISTLSTSDFMNSFIDSLNDEKTINNVVKGLQTEITVNNNQCTQQTFEYYDKASKNNLQAMSVALKKNDAIWIVVLSYKKGDKKAAEFADRIINNLH